MYTKLKVRINIYDSFSNIKVSEPCYYLKIVILDIDERFQVNSFTGDYLGFKGFDFYVKCNKNNMYGSLYDDGIVLPSKDRCGLPYIKHFNTDKERKKYIKKMFTAFEDWSNYWWGFTNDTISKVVLKGDIFLIEVDYIERPIILKDLEKVD